MIYLSSRDIYLSLRISSSSVTVSGLFFNEAFEVPVILSAILFLIKSPVPSAFFWAALLEAVLSASAADCLA